MAAMIDDPAERTRLAIAAHNRQSTAYAVTVETDDGILTVEIDGLRFGWSIDWGSAVMACSPEIGGGVQVAVNVPCGNLSVRDSERFRDAHKAAVQDAVERLIDDMADEHAADVGESRLARFWV